MHALDTPCYSSVTLYHHTAKGDRYAPQIFKVEMDLVSFPERVRLVSSFGIEWWNPTRAPGTQPFVVADHHYLSVRLWVVSAGGARRRGPHTEETRTRV